MTSRTLCNIQQGKKEVILLYEQLFYFSVAFILWVSFIIKLANLPEVELAVLGIVSWYHIVILHQALVLEKPRSECDVGLPL